jgi:O-antigen ligase
MGSSSSMKVMRHPPDATTQGGVRWFEAAFLVLAVGLSSNEGLCTAGFAMVVLGALRDRRAWRWNEWKPLWLWLLWALAGPVVLGHRMPTGTGLARLLDWAGVPAAAWGFSRLSAGARRRVLAAAAVTFLLSCLAAGLQHFGRWPSNEALAWTHLNWSRVYELAPGSTDRFLGGGLVAHRLKFAHFGALVVVVLAVAGRVDRRIRAWAWASAAAGFVSLCVFPGARMAALSLTATLSLVGVLLARNRPRAILVAALFALATVGLMRSVTAVRNRFEATQQQGGDGDRSYIVRSGLEALRTHPVSGVGPGRFRIRDFASADAPSHVVDNPGKSHVQWLSVAAEQGLVGALLFAAMLWSLARRSLRTRAGVAATGALVFFGLLGLAHDPLFQAPFSMGLALVVGAALGAQRRVGPQPVRPSAGT